MSIYLEFHVVGNGRAFIEPGQIAGVITGEGCDIYANGIAEKPVRLLLRGGEHLDIVGDAAGKVLVRCYEAKKKYREQNLDFLVDYLEPLATPEDVDGT